MFAAPSWTGAEVQLHQQCGAGQAVSTDWSDGQHHHAGPVQQHDQSRWRTHGHLQHVWTDARQTNQLGAIRSKQQHTAGEIEGCNIEHCATITIPGSRKLWDDFCGPCISQLIATCNILRGTVAE